MSPAPPAAALGHMPPYGAAHLAVLAVLAAVLVVAVVGGRGLRGHPDAERRVCVTLGWVLLALAVVWIVRDLTPEVFTWQQSLPLHFSDALRVITALALILRSGFCIAVSYHWGLTLNLMSVLTPDLNYLVDPALEFAFYWLSHGAALVVPAFLVWGLGYRPTWRGLGATLALTAVWSALAMTVNTALGTNYGYLSAEPRGGSLLDLMGGWPAYLFWAGLALLTVWTLMTWPWTRPGLRGVPVGRGGFVARA